MEITPLIQYDAQSGELRPNATQDAVEKNIYSSPKYAFPNRTSFNRPRNSKSNPHHHSTRVRLGNRRARLTSPRTTLNIII